MKLDSEDRCSREKQCSARFWLKILEKGKLRETRLMPDENATRIGRHLHTTVTAVWRYINADYKMLSEARGLEKANWNGSEDMKLAYMSRVLALLTAPPGQSTTSSSSPSNTGLPFQNHMDRWSAGMFFSDSQSMPARDAYRVWLKWVEGVAARLG